MGLLLGLSNYRNNWKRLGFDEHDFAGGGSDRLTIVAVGDENRAADRIRAQLEAGADHVAVQLVPHDLATPPRDAWRRLAPIAEEISRMPAARERISPIGRLRATTGEES